MATIAAADEGIPAAAQTGGAAPAGRRIEALDFVRGVALCGILLMNITGFGLPDAYTNPMNAGGATGANLWAWIITLPAAGAMGAAFYGLARLAARMVQ